MKLKSVLREQVSGKQVSTAYNEISGEETVESTSTAAIKRTKKLKAKDCGGTASGHHYQSVADGYNNHNNHLFVAEEYTPAITVSSSFWGVLPSNIPN